MKAYIVVECYCLTEFEEEYNGKTLKVGFLDYQKAIKEKKKLEKQAKAEGQDYIYIIEEIQIKK